MENAVGIDLGTTNSALARLDVHGKPVVAPSAERHPMTPSVVCFKDSEVLVGDAAKDMQALGMWPVAAFFKRQMGDPLFLFHAHGVDYTATDLSALVLGKLKTDAETHTGEQITHAVITVPAYFRDAERRATIAAGAAAGLEVLQVINEPTAAAVAYSLDRDETGKRLLVYDLGGGTFDVTILELTSDGVRVRTSDGDHQLGGKDWDDRIIEFLAGQFRDEFGVDPLEDAESLADLLVQAEEAKKRLTSVDTTTISITHDGRRGRYTFDRAKFEDITADFMERTVSLTTRALEDLKLLPADIDGVLLVGGSTRMPMVHRFIEEMFGRLPTTGINVDEAVALGAAVVAAEQMDPDQPTPATYALRGPVKTIDVTNHSLGMVAVNADQSAYVNSIILPKNTTIPCEEMRPYQHRTRSRGDNEIEVFMTQGESESPGEVAYVGRYVVHDVPHQQAGITVVDVTYRYDRSGTVQVTARTKESPQDLRITVEDLPNDVSNRFLVSPELLQASEHVTVYLAFDLSGSMSGDPLEEAKKAALGFLRNSDLSHCSIGIIAFGDSVRTKLTASQNARAIEKAIDALDVGETGYGNDTDPFEEVLSLLNGVDGRRFAIALADGVWYNQDEAIERARTCHSSDIEVIAIGFGSADSDFLREIASSDESSFLTSMSGLVETFSTIAQVITETGGGLIQLDGGMDGGRLGMLSGIKGALRR